MKSNPSVTFSNYTFIYRFNANCSAVGIHRMMPANILLISYPCLVLKDFMSQKER